MRPFKFTGVSACNGKTAAPVLLNDTYTDELHMDGKDGLRHTADERAGRGGRRTQGLLDDERQDRGHRGQNGTVRARTDSGECTITATLATAPRA
mgnify:CR=1 FL=1